MTAKPPHRITLYAPYAIMLAFNLAFVLLAFALERPAALLAGLGRIITAPSLLITDYIAVGGLGATLLNAAIVGTASVLMLMVARVKPNGSTIMAMWMTTGFAFFGKNAFNMIPLTFGVWLFAKYNKEPFINYSLAALLVATLSPAVSRISFLGVYSYPAEILLGVLFGFGLGFLFPSVSSSSVRAHLGYNLYNMGFAGGLICVALVPIFNSLGLVWETPSLLSGGNNLQLAAGLYSIAAALAACGLCMGDRRANLRGLKKIMTGSGRLVSDFYFESGNAVYLNMAALCVFATTLALATGAELNGPVISAVLTVTAFGSFGKHLRNVPPVAAGALICVLVNRWDITASGFTLAILFSTGLAPIAGQFGLGWGLAAGFLHVYIVRHTGYLSVGINLYGNGFAAGLVVMLLLPLITAFKKDGDK